MTKRNYDSNNKEQWVLITGASQGIGLEFAKLCIKDGYDVVLIARDKEKLLTVEKELQSLNHTARILTIAADLSEPAQGGKIYNHLRKEKIDIEVLINNAGFGLVGRIDEVLPSALLNEISLNIGVLTELTSWFVKDMVVRNRGMILNVASTAAFVPGPYMSVYYASKAYVLSFSRAISFELRNTGITVTALCPGTTKTGFEARAGLVGAPLFRGKLMDATTVARIGYSAMKRGQSVVVAGRFNALVVFALRFVPSRISLPIVERLHKI